MSDLVPIPEDPRGQVDTQIQESPCVQAVRPGPPVVVCFILCMAGACVSSLSFLVGALVVGFASSLLIGKGRFWLAPVAVVLAAALFMVLAPSYLPSGVMIVAAGLFSALVCLAVDKGANQFALLGCMVSMGILSFVADQWTAVLAGTTVAGQMQAVYQTVLDTYRSLAVDEATLSTLEGFSTLLTSLWVFGYFFTAFICVIAVIIVAQATLRRYRQGYRCHYLRDFDISFLVIIPLIAAIFLLAMGMLFPAYAAVCQVVGVNTLLCTRLLLLVQGIAAVLGATHLRNISQGVRVAIMVALAFFELFGFILSIIGLADLWLNIRKLPRKSSADDTPAEEASHGSDEE